MAKEKTLSKSDKADIHKEAMRLADEAWVAERMNIREGRDCQRFYAGEQWDEQAKKIRISDGRPVLTINLLPQTVRQMTGDLRKSPPSLKYLPAKGKASQETAEALNGITRHIEQQSNAKDCYVIATENAAITGQGFFRVVTEYSSDDAFEQDIRIKPIRDPFGALLDPYAVLPDRSDMSYGFVFDHLSPDNFKAEYPDASLDDFPITEPNNLQWRSNDSIRRAEYWRRKPVKKTLYLLDDGSTVEDEAKVPPGKTIVNQRKVDGFEVCMYMITGREILSGPHVWAGRYIPICMVVGEEITNDGVTIRKGMVHDARDPQRIYNYSRTASVEAVALQPKSPFIVFADEIKGYESIWRTAGSKNHPYLVVNRDPNHPTSRPERSQPPIASTGLDSQAMIAGHDLQSVTGIFDAKLGNKSNETSGVAIAARQQQGDTTTYLYPDNLARAIGYEGKILADLIPRVMDTQQQVRILKEDGGAEMITINAEQPILNEKGGVEPIYNLSEGEYDVTVVTGPNFASRRAEAAAHMIDLAKGVPMVGQIAPDLIVENMDFPGSDKIAKRIQRAIGIGDDGEPVQQEQPVDPNIAATAAKTTAEALKSGAQTDLIMAQTTREKVGAATDAVTLQATMMQLNEVLPQLQAFLKAIATDTKPPGAPQDMQPPPDAMQPPQGAIPTPDAMPMQPEIMGDDLPTVEVEGAPV
ncbi:MAG: hypothetical protein RLZZ373_1366 [Pseudomonadota bacterium]